MTQLTHPPRFFFSVGEPSGDVHAAGLIGELGRLMPEASFRGLGGPCMEKAGCHVDVFMTNLAVMGLSRVVWNIRTFRGWLAQVDRIFKEEKPDAVILVDFPGFNWHVARKAKAAGIPVYYFMPPQIWAWAQWRIRKMKKLVDHVLCCLDFERKWFESRGCDVHLIGHPFLEETRNRVFDQSFMESILAQTGHAPLLTVLPGSRDQEVANNLSDLLDAVAELQKRLPKLRPFIAAFKESQAETIRRELERRQMTLPVFVGRAPELMKLATCCLAVSGSVSMELLALAKPSVIYYRVGRFPLFVSRFFRRVKYITLTNLLAVDRLENESIFYDDHTWFVPAKQSEHERLLSVFPEFLVCKNSAVQVADCLEQWLIHPEELQARGLQLCDLLKWALPDQTPLAQAAAYIESTFRLPVENRQG